MSADGDRTIPSSARRKQVFAVWLAFLAFIFGFGWYKSAENARDNLALLEWNKRQAELTKEGDAEWKRVIAIVHSVHSKPGSQKALEKELNGGAPFELRDLKGKEQAENEGRDIYGWTHPKYGFKYSFSFHDGILVGSNGNWGGVPERLHPRPLLTADSNSAERLRQQFARFSAYVWIVAITICFAVPRRRFVASQISLAAALTCGMAWLVNPHYSVTSRGVFSNDDLFLAAIMLLVSVWAFASISSGVSAMTSLLHFRLRDLFAFISIIAIALAAGPFGYVTLLVALSCSALFVVFCFYERRRAALTV